MANIEIGLTRHEQNSPEATCGAITGVAGRARRVAKGKNWQE